MMGEGKEGRVGEGKRGEGEREKKGEQSVTHLAPFSFFLLSPTPHPLLLPAKLTCFPNELEERERERRTLTRRRD